MVSAAEIPPEILVSIFKYSQYHKDLLNFALVCRSWTDWAIDVGWRTCEAPLSKVLAVLDLRNERDPIFDDDADWTKFVVISNKVTRVKCDFRLKPSEVANFDKRRKENDGGAPFQNVLELIVNMNFSDFRTASIGRDPVFDDNADWTKFVALSNKVTKVKCNFRLEFLEAANFHKRRKENDRDTLFQNVSELIVNMNSSNFRTASI
ncbi:hypothetical protein FS837_004644, partial [Tulasnella sp. UAMH 9824]